MNDTIHLSLAFLCEDCSMISQGEKKCVACGSRNTMPLANVLNRETSALTVEAPVCFKGEYGEMERRMRENCIREVSL